jgi:predicted ester cyclase
MPAAPEAVNMAAFGRFHDAISTRDAELIARAIDEIAAPDVLVHGPGPGAATGPQALKQVWPILLRAYPDLHVAVDDLIAAGDKIVSRQTVTGTNQGSYLGRPPTGRRVRYSEIFILRFADGQLAEIWGVVDVFAQLTQLGAVPA